MNKSFYVQPIKYSFTGKDFPTRTPGGLTTMSQDLLTFELVSCFTTHLCICKIKAEQFSKYFLKIS